VYFEKGRGKASMREESEVFQKFKLFFIIKLRYIN